MYPTVATAESTGSVNAREDAALVDQAQQDPAAFGELYERYRTRIYWYIRARTPSDEDAADLTQQVFVSALDRLHQYRAGKGSFATWLFTIARNAATDFHRRRRWTTDWEYLPAALLPSHDHDLTTDVERWEAITLVNHLVAALPPDKRELLVLRYAADLPVTEIAAITGKNPGAIRKQLTRILQSLEDRYHDPRH